MRNIRPGKFVELSRTFSDFPENADVENNAFDRYFLYSANRKTTWSDLLKSRFVVILAEAGSGKTWELLNQCQNILEAGQEAFFIRLENLAKKPLGQCFSTQEGRARFVNWRESANDGLFFLDAVDEAKLTTRHAFEGALDSFLAGVGDAKIGQIRLVVTSRVSGWRSLEDASLLRSRLDIPGEFDISELDSEDNNKTKNFRVVIMDNLSDDQVGILARRLVPEGFKDFIRALNEYEAWAFARRPQDVAQLAGYWNQRGEFGNLTELLEFDISSRLRETDEDRQQDGRLTDNELRKGAEALAAALIFGKTFSIKLENETTVEGGDNAVLPSKELTDWQARERRDLLTRGVFDPVAFGLVRFHHRSIVEYLAACWLRRLLNQDLPISDILGDFFVRSHGEEVLIPSRAAVACWLSLGDETWSQRFRKKLIEISPEVFLVHGDGTRLDVKTREAVLREIVNKTTVKGGFRVEATNDQLKRLSHEELAPVISELLCSPDASEDSQLILLRLIREGALAECTPAVLALGICSRSSGHVVAYAIAAIARSGSSDEISTMVSSLLSRNEVDESVSCQIINDLYPGNLNPEDIVTLSRKTRQSRFSFPDFANDVKQVIVEKSPDIDLEVLLDGFMGLLNERPGITVDNGSKSFLVSQKNIWLNSALRAVVSRILAMDIIPDNLAKKIVSALFLTEIADEVEIPSAGRKIDLQVPSITHTNVRRFFYFRKLDEIIRQNVSLDIGVNRIFSYYTPLRYSERDISWVVGELNPDHSMEHRRRALYLARYLWFDCGRPLYVKEKIYSNVRDNSDLTNIFKMNFRSVSCINLKKFSCSINNYIGFQFRQDKRRLVNGVRKILLRFRLFLRRGVIRNGVDMNALVFLYRKSSVELDSSWREYKESLAKQYGLRISSDFIEGCRVNWRRHSPSLRHERPSPGIYDWRTAIGQLGLRIDFENGVDPATLSDKEAGCAARYAVEELNGFPPWLPSLVRAHPRQVQLVLISCIEADWRFAGEGGGGGEIARQLCYAAPNLQKLVASDVLAMLSRAGPGSPNMLLSAISLVSHGDSTARPEIARIAATRLPSLALDSPLAAQWLIAWLWLDAVSALDWLEAKARSSSRADVGDLLLAVGDLVGRHGLRPQITDDSPGFHKCGSLVRLIRIYFDYIRTDEDIDRLGVGSYSPNSRDNAQVFRDALLSQLISMPGGEAHTALLGLAKDPNFVRMREYLLRSAWSRRRRDAEPDPWRPGDASAFAASFDHPIRSGNDLFELASRRCYQLKDEIDDADFRRREGLPTEGDEDRLQEWLSMYFSNKSSGKYTVYREAVVAHGKKPDIRLQVEPYPPTSIEVKWGDSWSYNELSDALSEQLVGQYMRSRQSRHGVLLIGWKGRKKKWRTQDGAQITFPELIERLEGEAKLILSDRLDIDGLKVIGIDFST